MSEQYEEPEENEEPEEVEDEEEDDWMEPMTLSPRAIDKVWRGLTREVLTKNQPLKSHQVGRIGLRSSANNNYKFNDYHPVSTSQAFKTINVLLVGYHGSGKTAFANTIRTIFSRETKLAFLNHGDSAATDAHGTTEFRINKIHDINVGIMDFWGTEGSAEDTEVQEKYAKALQEIVKGNMKPGGRKRHVDDGIADLVEDDGKDDELKDNQPHSAIVFVEASLITRENLNHVNVIMEHVKFLQTNEIRVVVAITKPDKVDQDLVVNTHNTFQSESIRKIVNLFIKESGMLPKDVFVLKMYHQEEVRNKVVESMALLVLREAMDYGMQYIQDFIILQKKPNLNNSTVIHNTST